MDCLYTWDWFSVETNAKAMYSGFLRLKVDSELCIALTLHVIRYILAVHRDYDFQISSPSLTSVN